MSKVDLEKAIMEAAKSVPAKYGEYRLVCELRLEIANIMGFKIWHGGWSHKEWRIENSAESDKVRRIVNGMAEQGLIRLSSTGMAYKVLF